MKGTTLIKSLFDKNQTAGIVFSNTFFQLAGKFISMSITMLTTILVARNYGVEGYGYFTLMQTIPALFFIIVDFGLNAIVMKELEADWRNANKYFKNLLVMRLVLSGVLIFFTLLVIEFFFPYPQDLKIGIYLSLLLIVTHALYATGNVFFQYKLKYDYSMIGYVVGSLTILALSLVLILADASVILVNFTYVIGGIVTFGISLKYLAKLGVKLDWSCSLDLSMWGSQFRNALPLGIMFIFSQVNFRADSIILSRAHLPAAFGLSNIETVAIYGMAYKIFEVFLVIPTFYMNAVYPIYVRRLAQSKYAFKTFFLKSFGALILTGACMSVVGYLLAPFMIHVIGGEQFVGSVTSLRVLFGGISVFFITAPLSYFILTLGKQIYLPVAYALAAVFNVGMNLYLIPRFSFIASSYLTWLSEALILVLLTGFAYRAWRLYNTADEPNL